MKTPLFLLALLMPVAADAENPFSGNIQIGFRGTVNPIVKNGFSWISYGAQVRMKMARRINSEFIADYYPSTVKWEAQRKDIRIGAIALYYPLHEIYTGKLFTPYFSFGTCATHTKITATDYYLKEQVANRWSFGLITGMGLLLHILPKLDLGYVTQYTAQFGSPFQFSNTNARNTDTFPVKLPQARVNFEGQLLFCMSVNYTLGDLW